MIDTAVRVSYCQGQGYAHCCVNKERHRFVEPMLLGIGSLVPHMVVMLLLLHPRVLGSEGSPGMF